MNTKFVSLANIEQKKDRPEMAGKTSLTHRVPFFVPILNPIVKSALRLGVPFGPMTLLTVRGRKSGKLHTTPVGLLRHNGQSYLIATFGEVNWVRNLRKAHEAIIGRGRRRKTVRAVELPIEEASSVLKEVLSPYLGSHMWRSFLSMGYDLAPDASPDDFLKEARRHPTFEVSG